MEHPCFKIKNNKVYYCEVLLKGVLPDKLEILEDETYPMLVKDKKGVWSFSQYGVHNKTQFITKDAAGFTVLGGQYALKYYRDSQQLYANSFFKFYKLPNAHPDSFRVMTDSFAMDNNQIYINGTHAEGLQIWTDFDADSIQFFGKRSYYFADKHHLYSFNSHFIEISNPHDSFYHKEKKLLRKRLPQVQAWWNLPDNFPDSLQHLGHNHYTDGTFVFYHFKKNHRYCPQYRHPLREENYQILPHADVDSFESLNNYYGKDKHRIYHMARVIDADLNSFTIIEAAFAKDNQRLHYNAFFVEGVDWDTLQIYNNGENSFVTDKNHLYAVKNGARIGKFKGYANHLKIVKNGDPATFKMLSDAFAKDKNQVYWYGNLWKIPDATSFEMVTQHSNNQFAKDKQHLYSSMGKKVHKNVDGATFVKINDFWGKDANHIFCFYHSGKVMKNIDMDSFKILDDTGNAQDRNYLYDSIGRKRKTSPTDDQQRQHTNEQIISHFSQKGWQFIGIKEPDLTQRNLVFKQSQPVKESIEDKQVYLCITIHTEYKNIEVHLTFCYELLDKWQQNTGINESIPVTFHTSSKELSQYIGAEDYKNNKHIHSSWIGWKLLPEAQLKKRLDDISKHLQLHEQDIIDNHSYQNLIKLFSNLPYNQGKTKFKKLPGKLLIRWHMVLLKAFWHYENGEIKEAKQWAQEFITFIQPAENSFDLTAYRAAAQSILDDQPLLCKLY